MIVPMSSDVSLASFQLAFCEVFVLSISTAALGRRRKDVDLKRNLLLRAGDYEYVLSSV